MFSIEIGDVLTGTRAYKNLEKKEKEKKRFTERIGQFEAKSLLRVTCTKNLWFLRVAL